MTLFVGAQDLGHTTYTVKGKLVDENSIPQKDLPVFVLAGKDSSIVKMGISGVDGAYQFEDLNKGTYLVKIETATGDVEFGHLFQLESDQELDPLIITRKEQTIQEVAVVKKKNYLEREQGKLILNVENSINSAGSSAFELIEKAPGVKIQGDDNINLNGKQGVVVLIDGKRIPMTGAELANYLRGIPSGTIEKIELIHNPSAKYDAAGSAIIDIKLKKNTKMGMNGSFTSSLGHGVYPKLNEGIVLNYRNKKLNLFGSYNYSYRKAFNKLILDRKFYSHDSLQSEYAQSNYLVFPFKNQVAKMGMDYTIDSKRTIGVVLNGVTNKFNPTGTNTTDVLNAGGIKTSSFETNNNSQDLWYNTSANLNYKQKIDTNGTELTCDFDYARYGNKTIQNFETDYFDINHSQYKNPYLLYGDLRGNLSIYAGKMDFVKPLKDGVFEAGVKSSYVVADNNLKFYNVSTGTALLDTTKSNHFIYQENINAIYSNWTKETKKWNFKLGMRVENTNVVGKQLTSSKEFKTNYTQLFPNVSTTYKLNENNSFDVSLYRRIDRPSYDQLNPFKFYLDPTTYREGNPYLRPQITQTAELAYTWKQKYYLSFSASRTTKSITEVIAPSLTQQNVTVQTNVNLKNVDIYAVNLSLPFDITKWWSSTNNFSGYLAQYTGYVSKTQITKQGNYVFNFNSVNSFKLSKNYSAELSGSYQSREIYAYDIIHPIWSLNAGIQTKILKNKGTLKLNVTDLLFTNKIRGDVTFTDYREYFKVSRETRVARLAFVYKFGDTNSQPNRRRNGGAEDIKDRVKGGMG